MTPSRPIRTLAALAATACAAAVALPASSSADVLVDQTTGTSTGPVTASTLADDFLVPAGAPFVLERAQLLGTGAGAVRIYISTDAGGLPAAGPVGSSSSGVVTDSGAGDKPPRANGDPLRAVPLPQGRYWLVATTESGGSAGAGWSWNGQSPQSGLPAVWAGVNSACPSGPGIFTTTYRAVVGSCGLQGPDLQWRLEGRPYAPSISIPGGFARGANGGVSFRVVTPHPGEISFRGPGLKTKHSTQDMNGPKRGVYSEELVLTPTGPVKKALTAGARRRITVELHVHSVLQGIQPPRIRWASRSSRWFGKIKVLLKRKPLNAG